MTETSLESKRRALIALRLSRAAPAAAPPAIRPVPRAGARPLPLSVQQEGLWFLDRLDPGSTVYSMPYAWRLRGPLDVAALRTALTGVVRQHEALRTRFADDGGRPYQIIDPAPDPFPLPVVDTADPAPLIAAEAGKPVNLSTGPVLRATLLRAAPDDHILLLTTHHIVADGWSMGIVLRELDRHYRAGGTAGTGADPAAVVLQPADVAVWQRERLDAGGAARSQLAYWRRRLDGLPRLDLPTTRPRPAERTWSGAGIQMPLPGGSGRAVAALARAEQVSFFAVLQAAFLTVLRRYTGQDDVVVGSVFGGRTRAEIEPLVGFFASTLVLRTSVAGDPTFRDLLARCHDTVLGAAAHQDVPFASVVEALRPDRDPGRNPLFQVSLGYHPAAASSGTFTLGELTGVAIPPPTRRSRFDLGVGVSDTPDGGLVLSAEYATELFDEWFVRQMMTHFARVLTQALAEPGTRLSQFRLLTGAEVAERTRTAATPPTDRLLGDLGGAPDATAITHHTAGGHHPSLTYAELDERADRWAHRLRHGYRVGAEDIVAILLPRGPDLVTAQLATTRAGAAWLCLDPTHPAARRTRQLADAAPAVVLTSRDLAHLAPGAVVMDESEPPPAGRPAIDTHPDNLAYLVYTSGTTGTPKGVQATHRNLVDFIDTARKCYRLTPGDRVLQFANPTFDVSIADVHTTLTAGATLVTADPEHLHDPDSLARLLREQRITVAHLPPAVLSRLDPRTPLPDLRLLIVGGEAYPVTLAERWTRPGREFHNSYGPTETTIDCTDHRHVPGTADLLLGHPMANHAAYLLDDDLNHVPAGVPGQLYIAGAGITRGYHNHPASTAAAYLPDPHHPGHRMYATGDLARHTATGHLQYLGRTDRQLKVNGIRIEPAEIEHALQGHPDIVQAVVTGPPLHAYVATADPALTAAGVQEHLLDLLPTHLVPATVTLLDRLPLTANGKIDYVRLPAPARPDTAARPSTPAERAVARLIRELLPQAPVTTDATFFALGGTSLQALQLITRLDHAVDLRALYTDTVAQLARRIGHRAAATDTSGPVPLRIGHRAAATDTSGPVPLRVGGSRRPLFCVHTVGGTAAPYLPLAGLLDDQPAYGLEAPGLHGGDRTPDSVADLAGRHRDQLRAVQPHGPYHLLGWSAGGLIAYEIARGLRELGEPVGSLILLDTVPPAGGMPLEHAELLRNFAHDLAAQAGRRCPVELAALRGRPEPEQVEVVLDALQAAGLVPADARHPARARIPVFMAISRATRRYRPRPLDIEFTVISAEPNAAARERGWSALHLGPSRHLSVPGTHYSLLHRPAVAAVARIVGDATAP